MAPLTICMLLCGGCNEEGASAACPDLPLYDVRADGGLDPQIVQAREEAAAEGCITLAGDAALLTDEPDEQEELE
jgi:hypothetical protein